MKAVTEWSPKRLADALGDCTEARRKYLRLGREIAQVTDERVRSNLEHTHSKLGIFLSNVLGEDWTEWITGDADAEMKAAGL